MNRDDKYKYEPNILKLHDEKHLRFVENLCNELDISNYTIFWQSRYNKYVRYDYEPFCTDGFDIEFHFNLNEYNINNIGFMKFIYGKYIRNTEYLKVCFNEKIKDKNNEGVYIKL